VRGKKGWVIFDCLVTADAMRAWEQELVCPSLPDFESYASGQRVIPRASDVLHVGLVKALGTSFTWEPVLQGFDGQFFVRRASIARTTASAAWTVVMHETPCWTAAARMRPSSVRAPLPLGVFMTSPILSSIR
jgi:hypothetical protein